MKAWLRSNSAQVLYNFGDHMERFGAQVQDCLTLNPPPPLPMTPPKRYTKPFAVFTPSKHNHHKKRRHKDEDQEDQEEHKDEDDEDEDD
ncbi:hypothetical protein EC957_010488 [Mortierella hygrophila]|uniref:Uncharacterized protein n=1 Tax=Mortierella hygrophila TaxID=979708 RepID=A0A9P6EVU8_9FUNG|nr:hypothetical protein EC957_010488 [Mortierella hygrophila]